ncbi:hypothetical protein AXG93_509s1330 [Marchantia polymorpha subsp. ruderalis]|uniref:Hyaluronan/mRNA-binding protein domain-containing protein n=1 Tax=Marchantia polymorpha subsp. ruderalis TaxID=1480154 RepID=A0A176WAQ2_MARPO|nr:hypothetical protein AXG93_509s1330 [Marchantia polymorpha subsp. ruderalis]
MEPSPEQARNHPHHHETYEHAKNVKKGSERLDRRSATAHSGPKKSGHGGKFTWDGPTSQEDYENDAVVVLDKKDPNYIDEDQEAEDKKVAEQFMAGIAARSFWDLA